MEPLLGLVFRQFRELLLLEGTRGTVRRTLLPRLPPMTQVRMREEEVPGVGAVRVVRERFRAELRLP